jgi:malonyl-CoA/methylmalonyl-CoA synthetase
MQGSLLAPGLLPCPSLPCADLLVCVSPSAVLQILGRTSVDIIKSGGYKLSALDIESTLLHHPDVEEAAVLGAPHEELGQIVTALVYPKQLKVSQDDPQSEQQLLEGLNELCSQELPKCSVPRKWVVLDAPLPRNAMGKVNKKELLAQFLS